MINYNECKNQIAQLESAEYHYNCLICSFVDDYLGLKDFGNDSLPELAPVTQWLTHLHKVLRPSLRQAQENMASHFGIELGDHVKANGVELYVASIMSGRYIIFKGYGVKNDGTPAQVGAYVEIQKNTIVEKLPGSLTPTQLEALLFSWGYRTQNVLSFIRAAIAQLP